MNSIAFRPRRVVLAVLAATIWLGAAPASAHDAELRLGSEYPWRYLRFTDAATLGGEVHLGAWGHARTTLGNKGLYIDGGFDLPLADRDVADRFDRVTLGLRAYRRFAEDRDGRASIIYTEYLFPNGSGDGEHSEEVTGILEGDLVNNDFLGFPLRGALEVAYDFNRYDGVYLEGKVSQEVGRETLTVRGEFGAAFSSYPRRGGGDFGFQGLGFNLNVERQFTGDERTWIPGARAAYQTADSDVGTDPGFWVDVHLRVDQ